MRPGDPIALKLSGAPGNPQDWIALFPVEVDSRRYTDGHDLIGENLKGRTEGEFSFTAPQKEGNYEFRLFADWPEGGFEVIATSNVVRVSADAPAQRKME